MLELKAPGSPRRRPRLPPALPCSRRISGQQTAKAKDLPHPARLVGDKSPEGGAAFSAEIGSHR